MLTVDLENDFGVFETTKCMEVLPKFVKMLDRNGIEATFFVNGELLPKFNVILKEISKKHEIACHGLNHDKLTDKPIEQVKNELIEVKELFKKNLGIDPVGFRAPFFMINDDILKMLPKVGFKYDSSVVPGFHLSEFLREFPNFKIFKTFNFKDKKEPYYINGLLEIPISKMILPFGTNWFQFIGKNAFSWLFKNSGKYNTVIYAHMNEFCPVEFNLSFKRKVLYRRRGEERLKEFEEFLKGMKNYYEFIRLDYFNPKTP